MGDSLEIKVTFEPDGVTVNNLLLTRVDHNLYSVEETPVLVSCVWRRLEHRMIFNHSLLIIAC
jgi:hypothetical protein